MPLCIYFCCKVIFNNILLSELSKSSINILKSIPFFFFDKGSFNNYVDKNRGDGVSRKSTLGDVTKGRYHVKCSQLSTRGGALCVQMEFTRTFEANTKCNNMKYVWSHFYQILVVLKYHRRLWNNIFDTDIFRCINTHIKGVYLAFFGIFMLLEMSVSKILFHRRLWYFRTTKIW